MTSDTELTTLDSEHPAYKAYIAHRVSKNISAATPEFLERHSLTPEDVKEFNTSPSFAIDIQRATRAWMLLMTPDIAHSTYEQAKAGNSKAVGNWIKMLKEMDDRVEAKGNTTNITNVFQLSPNQAQQLGERLLARGIAEEILTPKE